MSKALFILFRLHNSLMHAWVYDDGWAWAVDVIMNIKNVYKVKRNWMGEPCFPRNYSSVDLMPPAVTMLPILLESLLCV